MSTTINHKYIKLKKGVNVWDLLSMKPELMEMLAFVSRFAHEHNLPCLISSITDPAKNRVTKSHAQGRAFDLSIRGWPIGKIKLLIYLINERFKKVGAIGRKSGLSRPVVYHKVKGNVYHFHFQVRP